MAVKAFFELPLSHSYVGFSREVRHVNVTFVDQGSCSTAPLKGQIVLGLQLQSLVGSSDVFERVMLWDLIILWMFAVQLLLTLAVLRLKIL